MKDDSKLQEIRDAMLAEDWSRVIKIAATFQRLGKNKETIQKAADSLVNADFYIQIGYDPQKLFEEGIAAVKERFNKSWEEILKQKNGS
ncbi:MAG: hypothetical protein ABI863_10450 [Ginsengibacter sp.]